ncbi:unnamed protein product [Trichobilharzia szidati]|nr:unnamed protein product [Trichobilharzia szidati]
MSSKCLYVQTTSQYSSSIRGFLSSLSCCSIVTNHRMGNICNYLCPPTGNRFLSTSELRTSRHDSDVKILCDNEVVPTTSSSSAVNDNYDAAAYDDDKHRNEQQPSVAIRDKSSARHMQRSSTTGVHSSQQRLLSQSSAPATAKTPSYPSQGPKVVREYVNFPFLTDNEIGNWITNCRFMFILRGPPGAGKSFISECIRIRFPMAKVCSADDFWYLESNGFEYQFDINRLNEAHEWCQNNAYTAAASGHSPIIIDNTNVRNWETRYYTDLARRFNYFVIMVIPQTPWRFDAETLAMRNVHFVSLETVEAKVRNFEHIYPLYYGWFWSGPPSELSQKQNTSLNASSTKRWKSSTNSNPCIEVDRFLHWAWNALNTIMELPGIREEFANEFGLPEDATVHNVLSHWESATIPDFGTGLKTSKSSSIPHITAKYSRFGRASGAERYALRRSVTENLLGKLFTIQITGLVISTRTIGARVRLPNDEVVIRHLWASDDQEVVFPDNCGIMPMNRPTGCRAHVTLALAPGVSPAETGRDLLRVVDMELNNRPGDHVAIMKNGSIRRLIIPKLQLNSSPDHQFTQTTMVGNSNNHYPHDGNYCYASNGVPQNYVPDYETIYVYDLDFPQHYRVAFAASY